MDVTRPLQANRSGTQRWHRLQSVCLLAPFVLFAFYYEYIMEFLGLFRNHSWASVWVAISCVPLALCYLAAAAARKNRAAIALYLVFWGTVALVMAVALLELTGTVLLDNDVAELIVLGGLWYALPAILPFVVRPVPSVLAVVVLLALGIVALVRVRRAGVAQTTEEKRAARARGLERAGLLCPILAHPLLYGMGVLYKMFANAYFNGYPPAGPLFAAVMFALTMASWAVYAFVALRTKRRGPLGAYTVFWLLASLVTALQLAGVYGAGCRLFWVVRRSVFGWYRIGRPTTLALGPLMVAVGCCLLVCWRAKPVAAATKGGGDAHADGQQGKQ